MTITLKERILAESSAEADTLNRELSGRGVFVVNILGGAGAGKTSSLVRTIARLGSSGRRIRVIEGDISSSIDTDALRALGVEAYQIETGGQCHLDARMIRAILAEYPVDDGAILFIENIGNLVCPADVSIGEHRRLLVCSIPEGADKPYKYPRAFQTADAIVLSKTDLAPYVAFDEDYFLRGVRALNPTCPVFRASAVVDEGFSDVASWILREYAAQRA